MSDTVRTRDQLLTLLADNSTKNIHPSTARDVCTSCFGFIASADPTVNDDSVNTSLIGAFFDIGSVWINTISGEVWTCMDGTPTAAVWKKAGVVFGTSAGTACEGNDPRLSDARTPTAHHTSHEFGGLDYVNPHFGASAGTVCEGDDVRLSDARFPVNHAPSHEFGGSDPIALDKLDDPTDITTLNASTAAHGLMPKLSGTVTEFLDGTGDYRPIASTDISAAVVAYILSFASLTFYVFYFDFLHAQGFQYIMTGGGIFT